MLTLLTIFASLTYTFATAQGDCSGHLNIPVQFKPQFAAYRNLNFVPPLRSARFEDVGARFTLTLATEDGGPPRVRVSGSTSHLLTPTLDIDRIEFLVPDLPPLFTYRLIFAHLLNRYANVETVRISLFDTPDLGMLKDQLARGTGVNACVRDTPLALVAKDFRFQSCALRTFEEPPGNRGFSGDLGLHLTLMREPIGL